MIHAIATETLAEPELGKAYAPGAESEAVTWRAAEPNEHGALQDRALAGGWVAGILEREEDGVVMMVPRGAARVYGPDGWRAGDTYGNGSLALPVPVKAGRNLFLCQVARGRLDVTFEEAPDSIAFQTRDMVIPHVVPGKAQSVWLGVVLTNPTSDEWFLGPAVRATVGQEGDPDGHLSSSGSLAPMTVLQAPVRVDPPRDRGRRSGLPCA